MMALRAIAAAAAVVLLLAVGSITRASTRDDIPSCREHFFKQKPSELKPVRDYFIIIDRTMVLDPKLQGDIVARAVRSVSPGDRVVVVAFSGLTGSEFTRVEYDGRLDLPPTESELENKVPARTISAVQECFSEQPRFARKSIYDLLAKQLASPLVQARRSEILGALTSTSRSLVAPAQAKEKVVLVVSDMLEYSDVASFYAAGQLRRIDPAKVMKAAEGEMLIGDFGGARVFVAGAAASPDSHANGTVSARVDLRKFWSTWIAKSDGKLVGWGEPDLLQEIR